MILNEEMKYITTIVRSLKESDLFINGARETTKIYTKEQKGWCFGILLDTFGANLLENLIADIVVIWTVGKTIRARQDF